MTTPHEEHAEMAKQLDVEEALKLLDGIRTAMHDQFPDHPVRLEQLDAAVATTAMVVEHLHDEEARHKHDPVAHSKAIGEFVREY